LTPISRIALSTNPPSGESSRSSKTPSGSLSPHEGQNSSSSQISSSQLPHLECRAVQLAERFEQAVERFDADAEAHVVGLREFADRHAYHLFRVVQDRTA